MAYADLSQFLPREGGFKQPGQFDRMLKAEASKRASYLSAMDQFYAQLEESGRQFDLDFGQRRKEFDKTMDLRRDLRNVEYGKLGLGLFNLGASSLLKDKDITYGYDWMDKFLEQMDFFGKAGGGSDWLTDSLDFDLGDVDLDLYGSPGEDLGEVWKDIGDLF